MWEKIKEKQAYVFCGNVVCEEGETEDNCPEDCKTEEKKLSTGMFVLSPTKLSIVAGAVMVVAGALVYFVRKRARKKINEKHD